MLAAARRALVQETASHKVSSLLADRPARELAQVPMAAPVQGRGLVDQGVPSTYRSVLRVQQAAPTPRSRVSLAWVSGVRVARTAARRESGGKESETLSALVLEMAPSGARSPTRVLEMAPSGTAPDTQAKVVWMAKE